MKYSLAIAVSGLIFLAASSFSNEPWTPKISFLMTGEFHGDEVVASTGELWFGIFPSADGFELRETHIQVSNVEDPVLDEEGQMTGIKIAVESEQEPLFLIEKMADFKTGPLTTSFHGRTFLYPGQTESINLNSTDFYSLSAFGTAEDSKYDILIKDYTLKLVRDTGEKQTIVTFDALSLDGRPELIWAGDLDRDGKLDLLFDLTDHYNVTRFTLFLSSMADVEELAGRAAELVLMGC